MKNYIREYIRIFKLLSVSIGFVPGKRVIEIIREAYTFLSVMV